ncbi:MAG: heme-binding protein [Verrucomicrobia bacterium]|nr:heme-binding protein [Verrucomicrobiota bacterium]
MNAHLQLVSVLVLLASVAHGQIVNAPPVPEWIQPTGVAANQPAFLRKSFEGQPGLLKAILLGACDGKMSVELNGEKLDDIAGRERATSLDVTKFVRRGTNVLTLRALNSNGPPVISALLEVNGDLARQQWFASDTTWLAATNEGGIWTPARSLGRVDAAPDTNPFDTKKAFDAYNSWKLALGNNAATDPATFTLLPGFKAELIRSAQPDEGSWVSMAFDPQGRLTLAREKRGLIRLAFASPGNSVTNVEVINDTLLECRGLLYAHSGLYADANNSKTLVRLRDIGGRGFFNQTEELLRTGGGVGHGRNHLKLGPDGFIYVAHGNNVLAPLNARESSPLQHYAEDQLIPCPWDSTMFDGDVRAPAGHILRVFRHPGVVDVVAGGFRNPLDVAFNEEGEMFTFDADMEWDVGAPWYMPNRVLHVVPGADFGFRRGTGRFPSYYADTLPSVVDIGLASPTAVIFGTGSAFPPKYRRALFICDWAYGRIMAVHLKPSGATYTGTSELFISGRPLNVTDVCIGPDKAMWFITGGRGTQSGLYRVNYDGPAMSEPAKSRRKLAEEKSAADLRALRRKLENLRGSSETFKDTSALAEIWPQLGHADRWIRHAARVALERVPAVAWQEKALAESRLDRTLTACLALARVGDAAVKTQLVARLNRLPIASLTEEQQLAALRIYEVAFARLESPDPALKVAALRQLEPLYSAKNRWLNHELCELLVYLQSPTVIAKTLPLLTAAITSEDLLQYTFFLRYIRDGWTLDARRTCFDALNRAEKMQGARQYFKALQDIRAEMLTALTPTERAALAPVLLVNAKPATTNAPAAFVKAWQMSDIVPLLEKVSATRSLESGRAALVTAQCVLCHRVVNDPKLPAGLLGPDLTAVSSRFNRRDLLEQILDPSKIIDEKFRQTNFVLKDDTEVTGIIEHEDAQAIFVRANPLSEQTTELLKSNIRERKTSAVSPMPSGLLSVLTADQILDLLTFFETAGKANAATAAPNSK